MRNCVFQRDHSQDHSVHLRAFQGVTQRLSTLMAILPQWQQLCRQAIKRQVQRIKPRWEAKDCREAPLPPNRLCLVHLGAPALVPSRSLHPRWSRHHYPLMPTVLHMEPAARLRSTTQSAAVPLTRRPLLRPIPLANKRQAHQRATVSTRHMNAKFSK